MQTPTTQVARAAVSVIQPGDPFVVRLDLPGSGSARYEDDVQRRVVAERVIGQDPHALGAADGCGVLGDEQDVVLAAPQFGGGGEHLPRTGEVEFLHGVEEQDSVRGHGQLPQRAASAMVSIRVLRGGVDLSRSSSDATEKGGAFSGRRCAWATISSVRVVAIDSRG